MKIGMLGGGQLARMLALSGFPLGIDFICIDPKMDCSAKKVAPVIHCEFDDTDKINKHFHDVDVVTYETENLPFDAIQNIAKKYNLSPNIEVLRVTQDRLYEKYFLNQLNIPTAEYQAIETLNDLHQFIEKMQFPIVIKTRRQGYDGKGQAMLCHWAEARQAWESMCHSALIVEKLIPCHFEVSLICARGRAGEISFYPLIINQHKNGILHVSTAPYDNTKLQKMAQTYALDILEKLNYVGVMTIEFFCLDDLLIANEIAPRVHNSGHWTIEGCYTSQFENHIRAISGLPLGSTKANGFSVMINFIGKEPQNMTALLKIPGLHFHTYGKLPMPNRKLGHVTLCANNREELTMNTNKAIHYLAEESK